MPQSAAAPGFSGRDSVKPFALIKALGKSEPKPAYFFPGQEAFLKKKAIQVIVAAIPEEQRDFNLDHFYGGEDDVAEVLTIARTLPFLAPRRVVVLRDLEKAGLNAGKTDLLVAYLRDPSPSTTFIVTTEDPAAARTWSKKCSGLWMEVDFRPLRRSDLMSVIEEAARERGVGITPEAVGTLVETVGNDLARINQEVEKLSLGVEEGGRIDVSHIHLMVCGYAYQTMFDLVQAVGNRDVRTGLILIARLFERGVEPPGLIGMLAKRLRAMWYLAGGGSALTVPSSYRLLTWQLKDLRRQAELFSRKEIESMLKRLLLIDSLIKSAPVSPRLLMEQFVLSLDGRGRSILSR